MSGNSDRVRQQPVKVLTIAGSDSGGAAGLQADLKTFTALGAYGMSVVTVVTAQNSQQVVAALPLPAELVDSQLQAVFSDYGAQAVKTGFIGQVALIERIAGALAAYRPPHLVVDPVLVNHRGEAMFPVAVTQAYKERLFPLADLVTPNVAEAILLSGRPVTSLSDLMQATSAILSFGPGRVLTKGFRDGDEMVDVLAGEDETIVFRRPLIESDNTHGSGDTLAAAICVLLAQGQTMKASVEGGQRYTEAAIRRAAGWRLGQGHGPLAHF